MKERIAEYLKGRGYASLGSSIKEVEVYSRQEERMILSVMIIDTRTFVLSLRDYQNMVKQIRQIFLDKGYTRIRILGLVLVNNIENGRYLATNDEFVWLIDTKRSELVFFENTIYDYDVMRTDIERLVVESRSDEAKEARMTVGQIVSRLLWKNDAPLTIILILINILIFVVLSFMGPTTNAAFMAEHGAMYPHYVVGEKQFWRLFTCMFLHFGIEHLGANMLSLYIFGERVERTLGKVKYLIMYILSGLGGSVASLGMSLLLGTDYVSAGASGAIFGVIGCLLAIVIKDSRRFEYLTRSKIGLLVGYSLFAGATSTGIDNAAHIGGLLTGVLCGLIMYFKGNKGGNQQ